MTTDQKDEMLH